MLCRNFVVHIQPRYLYDRMKTDGAFSIWQMVDAEQTDRQRDGV